MKIEVQHIPSQGTTLEYSKEAKEFPVLKQMVANGECRFLSPLSIELKVVPEPELIRVDGKIATALELACSRCLEQFHERMQRHFTLRFSRAIPSDLYSGNDQEVELTADEIGLVYFNPTSPLF